GHAGGRPDVNGDAAGLGQVIDAQADLAQQVDQFADGALAHAGVAVDGDAAGVGVGQRGGGGEEAGRGAGVVEIEDEGFAGGGVLPAPADTLDHQAVRLEVKADAEGRQGGDHAFRIVSVQQ